MGFSNCLLLSLLALLVGGGSAYVINVIHYGAKGNGRTDDSKAVKYAWSLACGSREIPTLIFPSGFTFLLTPIVFQGPCKSIVHVVINGNIVAPAYIWKRSSNFQPWIEFNNINRINIAGGGKIDGNGGTWWKCRAEHRCSNAPNGVAFEGSNNIILRNLKFINSPMMHITINNAYRVHISDLTITAPWDSPNTDGIHIEKSRLVQIMDSHIGTGDDCVSIGKGTSYINVSHVTCGPGHGISIGSLGGDGSKATVEQIHVSNCNLHGTTNGVRIKTWQGGSGYARGITFSNINFTSVYNPIIIDQHYCPSKGSDCQKWESSAVKVSDVTYTGLRGSSNGPLAISLNCSNSVACDGIFMQDIHIHHVSRQSCMAICTNAVGMKKQPIYPPIPCLKEA